MIWLGFKLVLNSGREARGRLAAAIDRVRTSLERFSGPGRTPLIRPQILDVASPTDRELQRLAYAGLLFSIAVAACSLAVSAIGSIVERRRPLGLLRLAGMPMRSLQALIAYEAALPLVGVSLLSAALGLFVADRVLRLISRYSLQTPSLGYFMVVLGGMLAALGILAMTLPLMRKLTDLDTARFE
ncbi:MAG: FtsX-like permease family protein [Thermomicrobiales bacterium]